jgi:hypothetical protein
MTLDDLKQVIAQAGGGPFAVEYAGRLLSKLQNLEATGRYRELFAQLRSAREAGDFRGRVLEANFADQCERNDLPLTYGAKQGQTGDVDFSLSIGDSQVFIEMKLLGESMQIKQAIDRQLEHSNTYSIALDDDSDDLVRIQRDLIKKATTRKFSPRPEPNWINIVAVDVSELQLDAIDVPDCLLAAGGNSLAAQFCDSTELRSEIVGVFEVITAAKLTSAQADWVAGVHNIPADSSHPREYIHGAMFLFRKPRERAALSYELRAHLVWNAGIITTDLARVVSSTLYQAIPLADSV